MEAMLPSKATWVYPGYTPTGQITLTPGGIYVTFEAVWCSSPGRAGIRSRDGLPTETDHTHNNQQCVSPYLRAVVPVEGRSFEHEPEALPLMGQEDVGVLPLLPQPAVAVGPAQLATGHPPPAQSGGYAWGSPDVALGGSVKMGYLRPRL